MLLKSHLSTTFLDYVDTKMLLTKIIASQCRFKPAEISLRFGILMFDLDSTQKIPYNNRNARNTDPQHTRTH